MSITLIIRTICLTAVLSSLAACRTTERCDAYTEKYDIHEDHKAEMKKYSSVETLR